MRLHQRDNVILALSNLKQGTVLSGDGIVCAQDIPVGHKIAAKRIEANAPVRKYGQIIGAAIHAIEAGQHVHTHNLGMTQLLSNYSIGGESRSTDYVSPENQANFLGYLRPGGQIATRNYIGVMATVGCSASVARLITDAFREDELRKYPNVDGVVPVVHGLGCGMNLQGEGLAYLQRTLAGFSNNPNFAGLLLVGLGCETNNLDCLLGNTDIITGPMLQTLNIQDAGGSRLTIAQGMEIVREMLVEADKARRRPVPASNLLLGLECGGSDSYSGITANPALGAAADLVVRNGGTVILSETPEIYGAEHLLLARAISPKVGQKLLNKLDWWREYAARNQGEMNNNPSPGNKVGGLTTILEKSLGAVAKAGSTDLMEVYDFAEPVTAKGMVFMDTPGYDLISITGMIAGGANMICFTTGRGSVLGSKPAPTIKLASNTQIYQRLIEDMDIECGPIVNGKATIKEMGQAIFDTILQTASGHKTKSENMDLGDCEFVPWPLGAIM
jgi:arabinonate dehydratase